MVTVDVLVVFDPPPRVARKTPAAMAAAPPITAIFTQVGENQLPCFSADKALEPTFACGTLVALDIEKVSDPT